MPFERHALTRIVAVSSDAFVRDPQKPFETANIDEIRALRRTPESGGGGLGFPSWQTAVSMDWNLVSGGLLSRVESGPRRELNR